MITALRHVAVVAILIVTGASAAFAADAFPVTIDHAFGATELKSAPVRVVTWGATSYDAVIALGVVPVAIPAVPYGGDAEGKLPWTIEAVQKLGGPFPALLAPGAEVPVEQIAGLKPDLIIAVYSGLTEDQYKVLSQIAPVVPYPGTAWSTSWQDVIAITGKALGKSAEGEALVADLEQFITDEMAKRPTLAGVSFAGITAFNDGEFAVFGPLDPRIEILAKGGMVVAPSVTELGKGEQVFFPLSYERADALTSDILVSYLDTPEMDASFFAGPVVSAMQQVQNGAVARLTDKTLITAVSPPSALSLRWGFPTYLDLLVEATGKAKQ